MRTLFSTRTGQLLCFISKIVKLCEKLDSIRDASSFPESDKRSPPPANMDTIPPATPTEVNKIITDSKTTTCQLDTIPTSLARTDKTQRVSGFLDY